LSCDGGASIPCVSSGILSSATPASFALLVLAGDAIVEEIFFFIGALYFFILGNVLSTVNLSISSIILGRSIFRS
jgi:hypothetical protein